MRIIIFLLCFSLFFVIFSGGGMASEKKKNVTVYKINPNDNQLVVFTEEVKANISSKNKIVYGDLNYTPFVDKYIGDEPLVFASPWLIFFGGQDVTMGKGVVKYDQGTVFIPKKSRIIIVKAEKIVFDKKNKVVSGKNAFVRELCTTDADAIVEKEVASFFVNLNELK